MKRLDLPQLDKVEVRNQWPIPEGFGSSQAIGNIIAVLTLVEYMLRGFELHQYTRYNHALGLLILGFMLYSIMFVVVHYARSDERGLTVHRLFNHQFMKWDDVREVIAGQNRMFNEPDGYVFVGKHQRIYLPCPLPRIRMHAVLLASIRQHLLSVGRVDNVHIPRAAEDLWWTAPDWVSSEAQWTNPYPPDWRIYHKMLLVKSIVVAVLLSIGVAVIGWERARVVVILTVAFIGSLYALLYVFLYRKRTVVEWVRVDSDGLEVANGFGKFRFTWPSIRESGWDSDGLYLAVRSPRVMVRLPDNSSASELHLCILKRLRAMENHQWIEVPARLGGLTHAIMGISSELS